MSWKKYGGTNNFEKTNDITVNSVVTNYLTLRNAYVGTFEISGNLHVDKYASIAQDLTVNGSIFGNKNLTIDGSATIGGTTRQEGDEFMYKHLYMGQTTSSNYFYGKDSSGIGINTTNPQATLDINGSNISSLNVYTSQTTNRNIIAQNSNNQGIVVYTDLSSSAIQFFNDSAINSDLEGDAKIQYTKGGYLNIDATTNTRLYSKLGISNRVAFDEPILPSKYNETAIIYDTSAGPFLPDIYDNSAAITGNALTLVANNNNNSNTFMNIVTPSGQGLAIGGGIYPNDMTKQMGSIGLRDNNGNYITNQTIISGKNWYYPTTLGINTHIPNNESYVLDINGPTHMTNVQIINVANAAFQINDIQFSTTNTLNGIAIGSPSPPTPNQSSKALYTRDGGVTWNLSNIITNNPNGDQSEANYNSCFVYDSSFAVIVGDYTSVYISYDCGQTWYGLGIPTIGYGIPILSCYVTNGMTKNKVGYNRIFLGLSIWIRFEVPNTLIDFTNQYGNTVDLQNILTDNVQVVNIKPTITLGPTNFALGPSGEYDPTTPYVQPVGPIPNSIDGFGNYIFFAGSNIQKYQSDPSTDDIRYPAVYDNSSTTFYPGVLASGRTQQTNQNLGGNQSGLNYEEYIDESKPWLGVNIIYHQFFNLLPKRIPINNRMLYDCSHSIPPAFLSRFPDSCYNSINVLDMNNIVAVGTHGLISYTYNGGITWADTSYNNAINLNSVYIYDTSNAIAVGSQGTIIYSTDSYQTWNPIPIKILDVNNNAGRLLDTNTNLISVIMLDINTFIFTSIIEPYDTINNLPTGQSKIYKCFLPALFNRINNEVLNIWGNMAIGGDIHINDGGQLQSNNSAFLLLNDTVQTINMGGQTTNINLGNSFDGSVNIQQNLSVANNTNMVGSLTVSGEVFLNNPTNSTVGQLNTGALQIAGGTSIQKNLNVGQKIYSDYYDSSSNIMTIGTRPNIINIGNSGVEVNILHDLDVSNNITVWNNAYFEKRAYFENDSDEVVIPGNLNTGTLIINNNGGASISGKVNVGQTIYASNYEGLNPSNLFIGSSSGVTNGNIFIGSFNLPGQTNNSSRIIKIGTDSDTVIISGNATLSLNQKTGPILQLNSEAAPGSSSAGSGLWIFDYGLNNAGTLLVSNNRSGYNFMAPYNNNNPSYPGHSPNNIVNFNTNQLQSPDISNAIIILQKSSGQDGANYTMNVAQLDVNNVLAKLGYDPHASPTNQVIGTNLKIQYNTQIDGSLNVSGPSTLSDVTISNLLDVSSISISNNLFIGGQISATNGIIVGGVLGVDQDTTLRGTLDVSGQTNINNTTPSTTSSSGALVVSGGVGIGQNANIGGTMTVQGHILTNSDLSTNNIQVNQNAIIGGLVQSARLEVAEDTTLTTVSVTSLTAQTILTSGSANFESGISIYSGGINIDSGGINIIGGITVNSGQTSLLSTTLTGTTNMVGPVDISGQVDISGNTNINGSLINLYGKSGGAINLQGQGTGQGTGSTITIGTEFDTVIINGNFTAPAQNSNITGQTVTVNYEKTSATAAHSGIAINVGTNQTAGYMWASNDLSGFIFKAPGSINTVNLNVASLKFSSLNNIPIPSPDASNALVILQTAPSGVDSSYIITTGTIGQAYVNGLQSALIDKLSSSNLGQQNMVSPFYISNTSSSNSTTTGQSLLVAGGAGIAANLLVGGPVVLQNQLSVQGSSAFNSATFNTATFNSAATFNSTATFSSTTSFSGNMSQMTGFIKQF